MFLLLVLSIILRYFYGPIKLNLLMNFISTAVIPVLLMKDRVLHFLLQLLYVL
jgi:hypothetical protein